MKTNSHWKDCKFLAIDVEGNGSTPQELIELAIVLVEDGSPRPSLHEWLIRPKRPITWQVTQIHGITNKDIENRPPFEDIAGSVRNILAKTPIIGHKVSADRTLLKSELPGWQPLVSLDTWKLAKKVSPSLKDYSLSALINEFELNQHITGRPHRAAYDATAAARLFVFLASELDRDGKLDLLSLSEIAGDSGDPIFLNNQGDLF